MQRNNSNTIQLRQQQGQLQNQQHQQLMMIEKDQLQPQHTQQHINYNINRCNRVINGNVVINGKLMKSASAASLNSRRRRHKTVHFGENLLREVCQNRKLMRNEQQLLPSGSAPMKSNIQLLYNFVEGVLSAWVDEDEDDNEASEVRSGAESEPESGTSIIRRSNPNPLRLQLIRRIVEEAAELHGTLKLGNSRFRHRHWRSTAKQCNEMFLRKVSFK